MNEHKELTKQELISVKNSFINILTLFLSKEHVQTKYVGCLLKWALQLQFEGEDLRNIESNFQKLAFNMPSSQAEKLDAIFDLVQMIYLDNVVEDIELEVASIYAEHLGFQKHLVGEVFQGLSLASIQGTDSNSVRMDIKNLISRPN